MTWSVRVTDASGNVPEGAYSACQKCKSGQLNPNLPVGAQYPCNVQKMAHNIAPILTCIDTGSDGHMASGNADLKCNGFALIEESPAALGSPQ